MRCNETRYTDEVQDSSSYLLLVVQLVNSSLSLPAILISGPLSDLKGRKVILLAAILASTVSALVYCFIEMFSHFLHFSFYSRVPWMEYSGITLW